MDNRELADEIERNGINGRDDFSIEATQQIIAALRRQPSFRMFKVCPEHKNVTQWTVHPTGYAIPAIEVCPVCEEIAYNQRLSAAGSREGVPLDAPQRNSRG